MVAEYVERLEHHHDAVRLKDRGSPFERIDHARQTMRDKRLAA